MGSCASSIGEAGADPGIVGGGGGGPNSTRYLETVL